MASPCVATSRSNTRAEPLRGVEQAQQDLDERGLARAVGTDQADDAGLDGQRQAIERSDTAGIALGEPVKGDE